MRPAKAVMNTETSPEKRLVITIRRRLRTARDAFAACPDRATALLDLVRNFETMSADLHAASQRHPAAVQRVKGIISHLDSVVRNAKHVVRNYSTGLATLKDQRDAFELAGLHLKECLPVLLDIDAEEKNANSSPWPSDFDPSDALKKRTAVFAARCDQQRALSSQGKRQLNNNLLYGFPPGKRSGGRSVCSTAALSDDATNPSSPPPSSSSSYSSLSSFSSPTFAGSENITVRPSPSSRLSRAVRLSSSSSLSTAESESQEAPSSPLPSPSPSPSSRTSPPTPTPSGRDAERTSRRLKKSHPPARISVSPGAHFVPYRSPTRLAGPRGTSLRGSGAIATRKSRFW